MTRYIVLSEQVITGTISDLPDFAFKAWIVVMFEQETLRGKVKLPVRSLAKRASITTEQAAEALRLFQTPDEFSSSKECEGRRLVPIAGEEDWYRVVTYEKHAAERAAFFATLRKQRQRAKEKGEVDDESPPVTEGHAASRDVTKVTGTGTVSSLEKKESKSKALLSTVEPPTSPSFKLGQPEYDLAALLLELIRKRNPEHRQPDLQKWAREIYLMHRVDARSFDVIREVIVWSQADEFWQNNILSPKKLRAQFDQLLLKSGNSHASGHGIKAAPMPGIE